MTELEKLQQEFKAYKETAEEIHQAYINKHNEWFKLHEENKQLRKALHDIVNTVGQWSWEDAIKVARQALSGEEKG